MVIIGILAILAGVSKSVSDRIALGQWLHTPWIGQGSSGNKWGNGAYSGWYYFGLYQPIRAEKFPYSSTMLVWVTDGWHFFNFITYTAYELMPGYLLYGWSWKTLVCAMTIKIIRGIAFSIFYDKVFK